MSDATEDAEALHFAMSHPEAVARQMRKLEAQRDAARKRASEYHRRAQKAEAVAAKSFEAQTSGGANVGRALARVAAEHYKSEADRLRSAVHALLRGDLDAEDVARDALGQA